MTIDGHQARRLRFDREAIVKLWPGVGPPPVAEAPPEPAQERAKRGRPAYPERDAVIAEMQPLLDQCNGKMSVTDANKAVREIALSQGLGHLPSSTLRDYRLAAAKHWEDKRK
jgi:hypothetical protein